MRSIFNKHLESRQPLKRKNHQEKIQTPDHTQKLDNEIFPLKPLINPSAHLSANAS
jgi:hypothetical protein